MSLLKSAIVIPALASGAWLIQTGPPPTTEFPLSDPQMEMSTQSQSTMGLEAAAPVASETEILEHAIIARRLRIEQILVTLDQVAEVALGMSPDQAARLEPVIIDLAEQTLELTTAEAALSNDTDDQLTELEETISQLVTAVEKMVQPEMSL